MTDTILKLLGSRPALIACCTAVLLLAGPWTSGRVHALCGDGSGDGYVTATDALVALSLSTTGGYDARADVQPNGAVTATDALMILTSAAAGGIPGCAAADTTKVIAVTASCDFATGGLAEIDLATFDVSRHRLGAVDADSVVRIVDNRIFVLNRFRGSSVQEINPAGNLDALWGCSVGAGSNPHDIAIVSATKAYVSRYDATTLAVVDLSRGPGCKNFTTSTIDLSPWADADGVPEMDQMVVVGERLFVAIQRLDRKSFFRPAGNGALVVIDIPTDTVVDVVELEIENPFVESKGLTYHATTNRIYVGGPGDFFTDLEDGGIEIVNPDTLKSEGVAISGAELGGDLTDFALVGSRRGYAIIAGENFVASVIEFDLGTRSAGPALMTSPQELSDAEVTETGFLWVADRHCSNPGFRVFDMRDDSEATTEPIYPGLTPFNFVFAR